MRDVAERRCGHTGDSSCRGARSTVRAGRVARGDPRRRAGPRRSNYINQLDRHATANYTSGEKCVPARNPSMDGLPVNQTRKPNQRYVSASRAPQPTPALPRPAGGGGRARAHAARPRGRTLSSQSRCQSGLATRKQPLCVPIIGRRERAGPVAASCARAVGSGGGGGFSATHKPCGGSGYGRPPSNGTPSPAPPLGGGRRPARTGSAT